MPRRPSFFEPLPFSGRKYSSKTRARAKRSIAKVNKYVRGFIARRRIVNASARRTGRLAANRRFPGGLGRYMGSFMK